MLLANVADQDRSKLVPACATYMRRCLRSFHTLQVKQDTSLLDYTVQAEPLWHNHRFQIGVGNDRALIWQKHYETTHVLSLLNERSRPFKDADWNGFFFDMAPKKTFTRKTAERMLARGAGVAPAPWAAAGARQPVARAPSCCPSCAP